MLMLFNKSRADGAKIICNTALKMCELLKAQHPICFSKVYANSHRFLDVYDQEELLAPSNVLAFAEIDQQLVAAISLKPKLSDNGVHFIAAGLVSTGEASNIATPLIAAALRGAKATSNLPISAEAFIREIEGVPNIGSARAFNRNGFTTVLRDRGPIEDTGRHFILTEPFNAPTIAVHRLFAHEQDIAEMGEWALRDWKEERK